MSIILLIIVLVLVFLLVKSLQDARARAAASSSQTSSKRPRRTRASREGRSRQPAAKPIDQDALAAHVAKLREAVASDLISFDEAAASVVRHTDGALSEEAARKMLETDEAA